MRSENSRMTSLPQIDVVIPVLNGEATVEAVVHSVLQQSGVHTRAIVVDAGSTDATVALMQQMQGERVQLVTTDRQLLAGAARNRGLEHCQAAWLSFLDADDLWPTNRSEQLLAAITNPSQQMAVGETLQFSDNPATQATSQGHAPCSGNLLIARDTFEQVGRFNPDLPVGEMVEWIARARTAGIEELQVPVVALLRRSHAHNTSRKRRQAYGASVLQIVREHRNRLAE
jgi:glycosyltransferase involved in cell wall biosynthesis